MDSTKAYESAATRGPSNRHAAPGDPRPSAAAAARVKDASSSSEDESDDGWQQENSSSVVGVENAALRILTEAVA